MTRTFLLLFGALAFISTACERHPKEALEDQHTGSVHEPAHQVQSTGETRTDAPKAPNTIPTNPSGSAPVQETNDKGQPPGRPVQPPTLFPSSK